MFLNRLFFYFQSLLSSGILTRDILQEVLHFIESNIPFFGLDSFLMLLMPFEICVDFLIEMRPEYLLDYAKCVSTDDQKWQYVLTQITMQFDRIIQNQSQEFYETLLKGKRKTSLLKNYSLESLVMIKLKKILKFH